MDEVASLVDYTLYVGLAAACDPNFTWNTLPQPEAAHIVQNCWHQKAAIGTTLEQLRQLRVRTFLS
jgi:hypothetical protein